MATLETPTGTVKISTENLIHEQCAVEFLQLINNDPVKLLEQLIELNKTNPNKIVIR